MPPPVAPPCGCSFHTLSTAVLPVMRRLVPPQARTNGSEAGKSTCCLPSVTPSVEPLSPDAAQTVTPSAAAAGNASSYAVIDCGVKRSSGPPQLIETTDGLFFVSCTALVIALRKPASVFGAK